MWARSLYFLAKCDRLDSFSRSNQSCERLLLQLGLVVPSGRNLTSDRLSTGSE